MPRGCPLWPPTMRLIPGCQMRPQGHRVPSRRHERAVPSRLPGPRRLRATLTVQSSQALTCPTTQLSANAPAPYSHHAAGSCGPPASHRVLSTRTPAQKPMQYGHSKPLTNFQRRPSMPPLEYAHRCAGSRTSHSPRLSVVDSRVSLNVAKTATRRLNAVVTWQEVGSGRPRAGPG